MKKLLITLFVAGCGSQAAPLAAPGSSAVLGKGALPTYEGCLAAQNNPNSSFYGMKCDGLPRRR